MRILRHVQRIRQKSSLHRRSLELRFRMLFHIVTNASDVLPTLKQWGFLKACLAATSTRLVQSWIFCLLLRLELTVGWSVQQPCWVLR
jgi:hypothetical protein